MTSLAYRKHKQKNLEFAWQHFGAWSSFCIKINFDPMVKWRRLDQINIYRVCNYNFLINIKFHVYGSWDITNNRCKL
jgi:hypothetical protein